MGEGEKELGGVNVDCGGVWRAVFWRKYCGLVVAYDKLAYLGLCSRCSPDDCVQECRDRLLTWQSSSRCPSRSRKAIFNAKTTKITKIDRGNLYRYCPFKPKRYHYIPSRKVKYTYTTSSLSLVATISKRCLTMPNLPLSLIHRAQSGARPA